MRLGIALVLGNQFSECMKHASQGSCLIYHRGFDAAKSVVVSVKCIAKTAALRGAAVRRLVSIVLVLVWMM